MTESFPLAPLFYLETLWFQVAGTLCNLECAHCLVSASPRSQAHALMTLAEVEPLLAEADALGVREYYFTGGEPFLNRELPAILAAALHYGPANVLTNGTLIDEKMAARLAALSAASRYSLEIRISLDGTTAAANDPVRGRGSFEQILRAIRRLAAAGLNPVITVTEAAPELSAPGPGRPDKFYELLRSMGISQPRLKFLSLFRVGEEEKRTRGYALQENLAGLHLSPENLAKLQCTTSRIVTRKGVYVCPILVNDPVALLGGSLREGLKPFVLSRGACYTCHTAGVTCRT